MTDAKFYKLIVFVNFLVPVSLLSWDAYFNQLGANPVEFFLRTTGVLTLSSLFLTLAISPLRKIFGWNGLIKFRRMTGLYAFFYGCLHLITYGIFDKGLDLGAIIGDVWQRPFIAFGVIGLMLMFPLAITSTNKMIKKLGGKRWQMLHRLIYVTALLGVVHFYLIQKSDFIYPILFGLILAVLFGYRINAKYGLGGKKSVTKA